MIGSLDIKVNAAHPELPLQPLTAFIGSPSSIRVVNVPRKIGEWFINAVTVVANYPDNTSRSASAVLTGGVWVATLPASTATGSSVNGYGIYADGVDENKQPVTGYLLGRGDVKILATDGTITIGETQYYYHFCDTTPTSPKKCDVAIIDGVLKWYNGSAWVQFGGVSAHASTHAVGGNDPLTPADIGAASASALSSHLADTANPHGVTASQVGAAAAVHTHTRSDITDFPSLAGQTFDLECSDGDFRKVVAKLWKALGGTTVNE